MSITACPNCKNTGPGLVEISTQRLTYCNNCATWINHDDYNKGSIIQAKHQKSERAESRYVLANRTGSDCSTRPRKWVRVDSRRKKARNIRSWRRGGDIQRY